jgi:hypothetical protein
MGYGGRDKEGAQGKIFSFIFPCLLPPDLHTPPHPTCVTIENCNKKNIVKVI